MQEFLARYMPPDGSAHGAQLDALNAWVHWLMLVLFVGWALYFIYVLWRFRASRNPQASYEGAHTHASTWVEGGIVVAEVVLLAGFSIPLWARWITPPPPERNPLQIRIVAEQFAWNIHYPGTDGRFGRTEIKLVSASNPLGVDRNDADAKDDIFSLNQLHLPVNRPVTIRVTSKDVIHSFSLPNMRVKQDAIPGMDILVHFTPVKTSAGKRWEIACAQLCGLGHYRMRGFLTVESPKEFEDWLAAQAREAEAVSGN